MQSATIEHVYSLFSMEPNDTAYLIAHGDIPKQHVLNASFPHRANGTAVSVLEMRVLNQNVSGARGRWLHSNTVVAIVNVNIVHVNQA